MTSAIPSSAGGVAGGSVAGSVVAICGRGVLIIGAPGSGKSDLTLRLLDRGALLVSDDLVEISASGGRIFARPGELARGRMDIAHIGLVAWPAVADAPVPLALIVTLAACTSRAPRIDRGGPFGGLFLPQVTLDPVPASAAITVELALERWGL